MTANRYFHIFESIPLGVVVIDLCGNIQAMNRYAKTILNVADTSTMNERIHALLQPMSTADLFQYEHLGEAGGTMISFDGRVLEIMAARMNEGKEALPKAVITLRDVTEMAKIQAAEKNNEKYAFVSELSADIAHEIRNPLGSIELLASLLKKEANREKDINRANQIIAAVKTVESAISNLIHRTQKDRIPVTHVNIHDILKEITLSSEKVIDGSAIFLSISYADVEPVMECNADMMKQLLLYLIINALTGSGRLDIVTRYIEEHRNIEIHLIETNQPNSRNNRTGVSGHLSYTKEDPWGLGMAIVRNIVNMYHGWMRVEYRKSIGMELVLSFPLLSVMSSRPGRTDHSTALEKDANEEK